LRNISWAVARVALCRSSVPTPVGTSEIFKILKSQLIESFCGLQEPMCDLVLFDWGADFGTFSALVCSQSSRVTRVVAFEPNPDVASFQFLRPFNFIIAETEESPVTSSPIIKGGETAKRNVLAWTQ
jgi:hypothetical protein